MDKSVELETKSLILDDDDNIINNPNSLGIGRETGDLDDNTKKSSSLEESEIFTQGSKNQINIPQTPNLNEKINNLFDSYSEEWFFI